MATQESFSAAASDPLSEAAYHNSQSADVSPLPIEPTLLSIEVDNPDKEKVKLDAADKRVACLVQSALVFFCLLVGVAVVMVFSIVQQFGLLALVFTSLMVIAVVGLACFLDMVMKEDKKWKPIRKNIRHWQAVTKAVLAKEMRDFQLDWHEYLLLTDGKSELNVNEEKHTPSEKVEAKHRSTLFRVMKPFLRIRNIGRRKKSTATETASSTSYSPPNI